GRREDGVAPSPAHEVFEPRGHEVVRDLVEAHQAACPSRSPDGEAASGSGLGSNTASLVRSSGPGSRSITSRTGAHSSAPTESKYANGTRSTSTNTVIATSPNRPRPRKTTANGYKNTISTSSTMKLIATR